MSAAYMRAASSSRQVASAKPSGPSGPGHVLFKNTAVGRHTGMDWPSQRHYRPSLPAPIDMLVYYAALAGLVGVFAVRPASTTAGFTV